MSDREFSDIQIFQHSGKGIPLFVTGHKNCLQADYLLGPGPRLIKKNLPCRGLTKFEKHCLRLHEFSPLFLPSQTLMSHHLWKLKVKYSRPFNVEIIIHIVSSTRSFLSCMVKYCKLLVQNSLWWIITCSKHVEDNISESVHLVGLSHGLKCYVFLVHAIRRMAEWK
jgi:hypothetical protein